MDRLQKRLVFLLALAIGAYLHSRAYLLAFTYDECWSFNYARTPFLDIFLNLDPAANNHILHSLLMKLSWLIGGQHEYILRLPVLLSGMAYLYVCYRIVKENFPKLLLPGFILLAVQPYLLDYFVAARGYGLALLFTMLSVYQLLKFVRTTRHSTLIWSMCFAGLAVLSNFTYVLIFIAVFLISFRFAVLHKGVPKNFWYRFATLNILFGIAIYLPMSRLFDAGQFYYGGKEGFWQDTVMSLSKAFTYYQYNGVAVAIGIVAIVAFVAILIHALGPAKKVGLPLAMVTMLPAVGSMLIHLVLDKPYLQDRTAIFFIPLMSLGVVYVLHQYKDGLGYRISQTVAWLLVAGNGFFMLNSINFSYLADFKEHADTANMLRDLSELREQKSSQMTVKLGKSTYMNATLNFYKDKLELNWLESADLTFCNDNGPYPYYYLFGVDKACVDSLPVKEILYYPVSETYLFEYQY